MTRATTLQGGRAPRVDLDGSAVAGRDRLVRRIVSSLAAAVVASLAASAVAEPVDAPRGISVVRGAGAETCPDADALAAAVSKKTGRAAIEPRPAGGAHAIDARVDRGPRGFEATIQVDGTLRAIEDAGPTCRPLADALTLMLVILLDESASRPAAERAPAVSRAGDAGDVAAGATSVDRARIDAPPPAPVVRPLVVASPPPPRDAAVVLPSPRAVGLSASVRAALTDGLQEPGALGIDARLRLDVGARLRLEAGALVLPTRQESFASGTADILARGRCGRGVRAP